MSRLIVEVCEIAQVLPHPNGDNLEMAVVKGWHCVIKKGSFRPGDRCVYFPLDSILPRTLSDRIGVAKYLKALRHDYPETVYSELQTMFRQALNERPDLNEMAANLAAQLSPDRKMLLGIQLYDLISRAGQRPDQVAQYYSFMSRLGMGAQAIDIVYQLNAPDSPEAAALPSAASPLESLSIGPENSGADVTFRDFAVDDRIALYRFHDLLLLKNLSPRPLMLEGRTLQRGTFGRLDS
jgi:hypothetical protein